MNRSCGMGTVLSSRPGPGVHDVIARLRGATLSLPPPAHGRSARRRGEPDRRRASRMREIDELKRQAIAKVDRWGASIWEAAQAIGRSPEQGHREHKAVATLTGLLAE